MKSGDLFGRIGELVVVAEDTSHRSGLVRIRDESFPARSYSNLSRVLGGVSRTSRAIS
ncbi:MAG: hypothetical protein ABH950_07675 [Candidatus Altiarchaeota archaeon]